MGSGCIGDETLTGYGAAGHWEVVSINEKAFNATATMVLDPDGSIYGQAPCNGYSSTQSAPYPWFKIEPIHATRRACADLADEQEFFTALQSMTLSEVSGDVLILSNDQGDRLLFNRLSAPGG